MTVLRVAAPAKVNLGLEILGRRPDGYHEIATILQTVSIYDRLTVAPAVDLSLAVSDPALAGEENLALRAARLLRERFDVIDGAALSLEKAIPTAAGLGGASSDAAATLRALGRLWGLTAAEAELSELAARLGSDVPFLLAGGTALATGRGERVEPLPGLQGCRFVVLAPRLDIFQKTATMYGALSEADWSSGARVRAVAEAIGEGRRPRAELLMNPFARPLRALRPDVVRLVDDASAEVGLPLFLSGAGPAHYAMVEDEATAEAVRGKLMAMVGERAVVMVAEPVGLPEVEAVEAAYRG